MMRFIFSGRSVDFYVPIPYNNQVEKEEGSV